MIQSINFPIHFICAIVKDSKWNTFQNIVKSIKTNKDNFSNKLSKPCSSIQEKKTKKKA